MDSQTQEVTREDIQISNDLKTYLKRLFRIVDRDNNKTIDKEELGWLLNQLDHPVDSEQLERLFQRANQNKTGAITENEWVQFVLSHHSFGLHPHELLEKVQFAQANALLQIFLHCKYWYRVGVQTFLFYTFVLVFMGLISYSLNICMQLILPVFYTSKSRLHTIGLCYILLRVVMFLPSLMHYNVELLVFSYDHKRTHPLADLFSPKVRLAVVHGLCVWIPGYYLLASMTKVTIRQSLSAALSLSLAMAVLFTVLWCLGAWYRDIFGTQHCMTVHKDSTMLLAVQIMLTCLCAHTIWQDGNVWFYITVDGFLIMSCLNFYTYRQPKVGLRLLQSTPYFLVLFGMVLLMTIGLHHQVTADPNAAQPDLEQEDCLYVQQGSNCTDQPVRVVEAGTKRDPPKYPICRNRWGETADLSILDFALFSKIAYYEEENVFETYKEKWFGWGDWEAERVSIPGSVFFYHFTSKKYQTSVITIRGTYTAADMVEDVDLFSEIGLFELLEYVIPTSVLPDKLIAWLIENVAYLDKMRKGIWKDKHNKWKIEDDSLQNSPHYVHYYEHVISYYEQNIKDKYKYVYFTGHSLGGGTAAIAGAKVGITGISFSGPGMVYSRHKFGVGRGTIDMNSVTVVPLNDIVPKVDTHGGLIQYIECNAEFHYCHWMDNTKCVLLEACGDHRFVQRKLGQCYVAEAYRTFHVHQLLEPGSFIGDLCRITGRATKVFFGYWKLYIKHLTTVRFTKANDTLDFQYAYGDLTIFFVLMCASLVLLKHAVSKMPKKKLKTPTSSAKGGLPFTEKKVQ